MSVPNIHLVYGELLRLKAKAAKGHAWTPAEQGDIQRWLDGENYLSVVTACCMLVSGRPKTSAKLLEILQRAIKRRRLPTHVEASIYEALVFLPTFQLVRLSDDLLSFIEESLVARTVDLTNAIHVLEKLARSDNKRALQALLSLAHDADPEIMANACAVVGRLGYTKEIPDSTNDHRG